MDASTSPRCPIDDPDRRRWGGHDPASALLDGLDTGSHAYVLEVSSPGVDRPLTEEKHFRRAHGRLVVAEMADGSLHMAKAEIKVTIGGCGG